MEPSYDTTLAESAYSLATRWDASRAISDVNKLGFAVSDVESYNSNQKSETLSVLSTFPISILHPIVVVFLERLATYPPLPSTHIEYLGVLYGVNNTPNAEIRLRFYNFALKDPKSPAALDFASHALKWITGRDGTDVIKGRMKFCRPTFRAAARVDSTLAKEYFVRSKEEFHPIARKLIEKVRCEFRIRLSVNQ